MTLQEALAAYQNGYINQTDLYNLFYQMEKAQNAGISDATISAAWQSFLGSPAMATTPSTTVPTQQTANTGLLGQHSTNVLANTPAGVESRTDPFTAYLSRLGIGSKQNYNPGEAYQASLFDPYKAQYDIQNRTSGVLNPSAGTTGPRSFSDFLDANGGGGMQGLISGAQGQLKNIFGATSDVKTGAYDPKVGKFGLGYEPGRGSIDDAGFAPSTMDPGRISELQDLLKYGLRGQTNQDAAAWAAKRLPGAQQSYYGQKTAGTAGATNFLDWLKQNWGMQF